MPLFEISGSSKLVHKEQVAIPAKHTEAVETRAEAKNKIQCNDIKTPVPPIFSPSTSPTLKFRFLISKSIPKPAAARNVLQNTISTEGIEISKPRIAVKPHRNTIK